MIKLFAKDVTYYVLRVVGFVLLVGFLLYSSDWRLSILGALGYVLISFTVSYLVAGLKLADHFPRLNRYVFFPDKQEGELSEKEWALRQAEYLESGFRKKSFFFTASEDGLIGVPIILAGITPITALIGGVAFGLLHLGRFTYLECIGKSVIYGLVCYVILPTGILSVVLGHFTTDLIGLVLLKLIKRKLGNAEV